jgi:hypothetical protein
MSIENAMKSFEEHSKKLTAILDEVSNKIREVEEFLQGTGCNYPFKWNIPDSGDYFSWQKATYGKKFRLFLRLGKSKSGKPFIEHKGDIRIKYASHLEGFLEAFQLFIRLP